MVTFEVIQVAHLGSPSPMMYQLKRVPSPWSPKGHGHGYEWITTIPFVQYQSALPFLRYGYFKIWPWKSMVKAMHVIKGQGHIVGSATNQFTYFSFHINWPGHSWDIAILKFYLKRPRSRSWQTSKLIASFSGLEINRYVHFLFWGNLIILSKDITNSLFGLENSRSRSWARLIPLVTFEVQITIDMFAFHCVAIQALQLAVSGSYISKIRV